MQQTMVNVDKLDNYNNMTILHQYQTLFLQLKQTILIRYKHNHQNIDKHTLQTAQYTH